LVKNPHHGSRNADQPRVWNEMLINHPYSVMTPFSGGSMPLPTESDCKRLASRTPHLYLTSPARGPKATGLAPPVEKLMRRVSPDLRDAEGPMGHVRWRMKSSLSQASVELFGRAQRVSV